MHDEDGCGAALRAQAARPRVLVVGGSPDPSSPELVGALAREADAVVAVDCGLDALLAAGCGCDLFCGDADSVGEAGAALVRAREAGPCSGAGTDVPDGACEASLDAPAGVRETPSPVPAADSPRVGAVERYDPHKDFTDLDLALRSAGERWPGAAITCTCVTGGRPDHALAVFGRLVAWEPGPVRLVEDGFTASILHGPSSESYEGATGRTFSFIPLSPEAVVSERGMRWELDHERVSLLSDLGVSNVIERDIATLTCHEGILATFLFQ